jgi:hypothetical protein
MWMETFVACKFSLNGLISNSLIKQAWCIVIAMMDCEKNTHEEKILDEKLSFLFICLFFTINFYCHAYWNCCAL